MAKGPLDCRLHRFLTSLKNLNCDVILGKNVAIALMNLDSEYDLNIPLPTTALIRCSVFVCLFTKIYGL